MVSWAKGLLLAVCAGFLATGAALAAPVGVTGGRIEGKIENGIETWRGIPFAAPPVGELRWRPPQPVARWTGVKTTTEFAAACMQTPGGLAGTGPVSEDCLYLNVWAPEGSRGKRLPVMVWIYGGGFSAGATRTPTYSGHALARHGVIVVSIAYRVGRFGFFAHPALTRETPRGELGNYAIMDQVAGLKWVQRNISAFGGDPRNVTIFGESAGGVSINALMATPAARGLFHKAISQSGFGRTVGIPIRGAANSAEALGIAFAEARQIGDGPDAAAKLRALPAEEVLRQTGGGGRGAAAPAPGAPPQPGGAPGGLPYPMIDGVLFREQIAETFRAGRQAKVPYIAGGNSFEASLFQQVRNAPQAAFDRTGDGARARSLYVSGARDEGLGALDLTTDLQVTEPNRYLARLVARSGQPAYAYYFSYVPPAQRATAPGAAHGAEIGYAMGTLPATATPDAKALSEAMSRYWVAFAKTGDPGAPWGRVTEASYGFMEFGADGPVWRPAFIQPKLDFITAINARP